MKKSCCIISLLFCFSCISQTRYEDSLNFFLKDYVQKHEVVKGDDKKLLRFYPVDKTFHVRALFRPSSSTEWLTFRTSGTKTKIFKLYGTLSFALNRMACQLNVYQSQDFIANVEYKNYLFLPFTDLTTGKETYGSGRYLDLATTDIVNNTIALDFNRAYNPYCAYVIGVYNCPIPPKENALNIEVRAGEKTFGKTH